MSEDTKKVVAGADLSELEALLKSYETDTQEKTIDFGAGCHVETDLFTLEIPSGYTADKDMDDFEVACYLDDFQTTPLQITVKAQPLVLVTPETHREELKNSILSTKGMVMAEAQVDGEKVYRFDLPTLGGRQMFFALYHETELFSLRINFVGRITNYMDITQRILSSFHFKDFQPRFTGEAVDSLCRVFDYNRENLNSSFAQSRKTLESLEAAEALCENYANALFGCFRVLDGEIQNILGLDVASKDLERLRSLGRNFAQDISFVLDYQGERFSVGLGDDINAMVDRWVK